MHASPAKARVSSRAQQAESRVLRRVVESLVEGLKLASALAKALPGSLASRPWNVSAWTSRVPLPVAISVKTVLAADDAGQTGGPPQLGSGPGDGGCGLVAR